MLAGLQTLQLAQSHERQGGQDQNMTATLNLLLVKLEVSQ
jgi:hypothetical protein